MKRRIYDIAIIGCGASGLFFANCLSRKFKTIIIDKSIPGKKILATGNGRCNLTNAIIKSEMYNTVLTNEFLKKFNSKDAINFFSEKGIEIFFDEEGRGYPISESAKDVQSALINGITDLDIIKDEVDKIEKDYCFQIRLISEKVIYANKVIVATGNQGLKELFSSFSLPFEEEKRVLTGFKVINGFDKSLFGIRENCLVKVDKVNFEEVGQVQFRKDGISGIVIFNLSAIIQKYNLKKFNLICEFLPQFSYDSLIKLMQFRRKKCLNLTVGDCLLSLLKPEISKFILKRAKIINQERNICEISDEEIKSIVQTIKGLVFECEETYEDCQVLSGGIDLKNLNSFESNVSGLYFIGEATNVYGRCGGYNLHWAWCSAYYLSQILNKKWG